MSELRKKPNPENVKKFEDYIAKLKAEISETKDLVDLKTSDGWMKIIHVLERKLMALDFDLDRFSILPDKEVYASLQCRKDIVYFISLIEGGEQALNELQEKLDKAIEDLAHLKTGLEFDGVEKVETHNYRSECPKCGRFLTRSMIRISVIGNKEQADQYRRNVQISYGAETKCKRCKYIGKTERIALSGENEQNNLVV